MRTAVRRSSPRCVPLVVVALVALGAWASGAGAAGDAGPTDLGILEWRGYPQEFLWRMEWQPVARLSGGAWSALTDGETGPVDTVFAPSGMGVFLPREWTTTRWACDTFSVAVGRWEPGSIPAGTELDRPVAGTTGRDWERWPLDDPAEVWHRPGRPAELADALAGLTRDARRVVSRNLPPGLEIDPEVPWTRENLRLAGAIEDPGLELVGRFRGAVRLRGGGASSTAVLHFWVAVSGGVRKFRYALLDLPKAGAARLSRERVAVLRDPGADRPMVVFRETSEAGRRTVILDLLPAGTFQSVLATPWRGCSER
jgi:hypothetical protein